MYTDQQPLIGTRSLRMQLEACASIADAARDFGTPKTIGAPSFPLLPSIPLLTASLCHFNMWGSDHPARINMCTATCKTDNA